ncbi:hypothetical protein [Sinisalibacter lacisalsi]|uniref:hypothetical protein n=1 Tax=Sinisalibacter lacisalsi TaxID=1526570 RepID=UPI001E3448EA|nr:hypothetical protein [Sinisalibacter lacisalsi]
MAFVIGAGLIVLGGIAFAGAMELWRAEASLEALAQGFLVPVSLILVGGFVIWMGLRGRGE